MTFESQLNKPTLYPPYTQSVMQVYVLFFSILQCFCLCMSSGLLLAQEQIQGKVLDAETGQGIEAALIEVLNLSPLRSTTSQSGGAFQLRNLPQGRYRLILRKKGYKDQVIDDVFIEAGQANELFCTMTALPNFVSEELNKANRPQDTKRKRPEPIPVSLDPHLALHAYPSSAALLDEDKALLAAGIEDNIFRLAAYRGGYNSLSQQQFQPLFRGISPRQTVYMLHNIPLRALQNSILLAPDDVLWSGIDAWSPESRQSISPDTWQAQLSPGMQYSLYSQSPKADRGRHVSAGWDSRGLFSEFSGPLHREKEQSFRAGLRTSLPNFFLSQAWPSELRMRRFSSFFQAQMQPTEESHWRIFSNYSQGRLPNTGSWPAGYEAYTYSREFRQGYLGLSQEQKQGASSFSNSLLLLYNQQEIRNEQALEHELALLEQKQIQGSISSSFLHEIDYRHKIQLRGLAEFEWLDYLGKQGSNNNGQTPNILDSRVLRMRPQAALSYAFRAYSDWQLKLSLQVAYNSLSKNRLWNTQLEYSYLAAERHHFRLTLRCSPEELPDEAALQIYPDGQGGRLLANSKLKASYWLQAQGSYLWNFAHSWQLTVSAFYYRGFQTAMSIYPSRPFFLSDWQPWAFVLSPALPRLRAEGQAINQGFSWQLRRWLYRGFSGSTGFQLSNYRNISPEGRHYAQAFNQRAFVYAHLGWEYKLRSKRNSSLHYSLLQLDARLEYSGGFYFSPFDSQGSLEEEKPLLIYHLAQSERNRGFWHLHAKCALVVQRPRSRQSLGLELFNALNQQQGFHRFFDFRQETEGQLWDMGRRLMLSYRYTWGDF